MGLRILLPCVNQSERHYTGAGDWIRIGLSQLRHVHYDSISAILDERMRNGPFNDLGDFLGRVPMPTPEMEILIRSGAFDAVAQGKNRPELMRQLIMYRARYERGGTKEQQQPSLFPQTSLPDVPRVRNYDWEHVLACEAECIGFTASVHPLALFKNELKRYTIVKAADIEQHIGKTITLVGWQVTRKRLWTRKDEPMVFITFEDTTGLYETVLFPRAYRRLAPLTMNAGPFVLSGQVTEEYGAVTVTVNDMRLLTFLPSSKMPSVDLPEWMRAA